MFQCNHKNNEFSGKSAYIWLFNNQYNQPVKGYIYKYTFSDGKVYIGQTRRKPEVRHREHLNESIGRTNPGFWDAYQRLGEPEFEVIDTIEMEQEVDLVDTLNRAETFYIDQYQASDPKHGYNKKSAGTVASRDEAKLHDAFNQIWKEEVEPDHDFFRSVLKKMFDKSEPLTEDEKRFVRECLLNSDMIFHNRVKDYNLEDLSANSEDDNFWMGEVYEEFIMNFDEDAECQICQFINENRDEILRQRSKGRIIQQVDKEGNVIKEYTSNKEIAEALNLARVDNVLNVLRGKQKSAYGFYWRYKEPQD